MNLFKPTVGFAALLSALVINTAAIAQTFPPITPSDRAENYKRQQESREKIDREIEAARRKAELQKQFKREEPPAPTPNPAAATYLINEIKIDSGFNMPHVDVDDVLMRYEHRNLSVEGIYALVRDVNNKYIAEGYSTTIITLKPSSLADGQVHLLVQWGRVEAWLIDGRPLETWQEKWLETMSLPDVIDQPMNIRHIDRTIEILNNGAKTVKVEILPGSKIGYSKLNMIQTPGSANYTLAINNQSVEKTNNGRYQGTLGASFGDALLPNDQLSVSVGSRYYNEPYGNNEYVGSFNYSLPIGYADVSFRYSRSSYKRAVLGNASAYETTGDSDTYGLKYAYNVWRNQTRKVSLYTELEAKNTDNYIEDFLISVSSKPYRTLTVGSVYVGDLAGGSLYTDLSYSKSIGAFGGQPAAISRNGSSRNFDRYKADVTWSIPFVVADVPFEYAARAGAQYTNDHLISSYKMGMGDEYTVRGYKGSPAFGDRGVYVSNTLSHTQSVGTPLGTLALKYSAGLDWGRVEDVQYAGGESQILQGVSVGVRASMRNFSVGLGYGVPLKDLNHRDTPSEAVYLSINASF